jgi:glycosyltransferase involved in cell wall biosynthesis
MSRRPTICFLTGTLDALAGAERVTAVIANALAARGYTVHVLALWGTRSAYVLHPAVTMQTLFSSRPSFKRKYFETIKGIRAFLKANNIQVLVGVDTMLAWFTWPATLGLPVRQIAWEHCNFDEDLGRRSRRFARRLAVRNFEAVVVLTERDRARWLEVLAPRAPIVAIPNPLPFDANELATLGESTQTNEKSGPIVLAVGRLVPAKGFDVLLHAWQSIASAYPDWRLRIVGEGEARAELEQLRATLGIVASVDFPGATQDILQHYRKASIFCLSSHYEGFGMVLIEAMACGLPVVSTDCPTGPREIIEDETTGLLVPPSDPAALARALSRLMEDRALRATLGKHGQLTTRRFDIAVVVERWARLLDNQGH